MGSRTRLRRLRRLRVLLFSLALASIAGWWLSGGRWFDVATPSMGSAAPVGSLLLTRPLGTDELRLGQVIAFRPHPGSQIYSHRIAHVGPGGAITTWGDNNPKPDPWTIHRSDVVGRVVSIWRGVGWLMRMMPVLMIGTVAAVLATRTMPDEMRSPVRAVAFAGVLCAAILIYRPLVRTQVVMQVPERHGIATTVVSTGLLPIRLSAPDSHPVELGVGEIGTIRTTSSGHGATIVVARARTTWLALCWLLGLAVLPTAVYGLRRGERPARSPLDRIPARLLVPRVP